VFAVCYVCEKSFEPAAEKLKEWADSEREYEPTDWTCPECEAVGIRLEDCQNETH